MIKRIILLIIINLIVLCCSAQIKYVDIIPDAVLYPPSRTDSTFKYFIDINNDSIQDYEFILSWCTTYILNHSLISIQIQFNSYNNSLINNKPAMAGDTIPNNSSIYWFANDLIDCNNLGMWYNQPNSNNGDKYLVLKIKIDTSYHYGWLRANNAPDSFILKDYAYNISPDESIIAGDTNFISSSIYNNSADDKSIKIFPNPTNDKFTIQLGNKDVSYNLEILNTLGQVVLNKQITNPVEQIDISGEAAGVYFVKVQTNNNTVVKKIIKN